MGGRPHTQYRVEWRQMACSLLLVLFVLGAVRAQARDVVEPTCSVYSPAYSAEYDFWPVSGPEYHRLLPPIERPAWYWTRQMTFGDPFRTEGGLYEYALITENTREHAEAYSGRVSKAFLLVASRHGPGLDKRSLHELYDEEKLSDYVQSPVYHVLPEYVERRAEAQVSEGIPLLPRGEDISVHAAVYYIDLNGDGVSELVLHVWYGGRYYLGVYLHMQGALLPAFRAIGAGRYLDVRIGDTDGDGLCQIMLPRSTAVDDFPNGLRPQDWVSTYEWDGEKLALNNKAFYGADTAALDRTLRTYREATEWMAGAGVDRYLEEHELQLGMIYYYKDDLAQARHFLQRVAEKATNEEYVKVARAVLQEIAAPPEER